MLSIKDSVFKERLVKKLMNWYVGLYIIEEVVSANIVKLRLLTSMRIYLVVSISWVVIYRKPVKKQNIKKLKPVEVDRVKE